MAHFAPSLSVTADLSWPLVNGYPLTANKTYSAKALRDFELIRCITDRQDEKVYQELWHSYQKSIRRLVQKFVTQTDAVQDLTVKIFVHAFKHLPRFNPTLAFNTWLFRVATNVSWVIGAGTELSDVLMKNGAVDCLSCAGG